jgi:PAS domain S-box-containing protein
MALFSRDKDAPTSEEARWRQVLESALRVSSIASSATPLPDALNAMVREAIGLLRAETGSIMLREEGGQNLVLVAAVGLPPDVYVGDRLPLGESVAGRVLTTGKPLLLGDVDQDAFVNFVPKSRPIRSSVVVPLPVQGLPIGVLNLGISAEAPPFTEEDLRIAQMFAEQAGNVIHMTRLHGQSEQRSSDLLALVESSKGLIGGLDPHALMHQVLEGASRLMGSHEGFVCLFNPDTGAIDTGVFRGMDKANIKELIDQPQIQQAIDHQEVTTFERWDVDTLVAAGLRTGQNTRGVLVVSGQADLIEDRHKLLKAFAQQAGMALGSAELHEMIRRKETELGAIAHSVPNPIILADARGRIVTVNNAAEEIFNISSQFLAGAEVRGNIGQTQIEDLLSGEGHLQMEIVAGNPTKTYRARVADVSAPGTLMGRVLIMDDVSAEREIAQKQRDFVAMIGHELRTPLTIIKGFSRTMLRRSGDEDDEAQEAFGIIDAKAEQLGRLIEDLLYVAGIESREASLRIESVDIPTLVRSVAEDVTSEHPDREVHVDIPPDQKWLCDETKVGLVLRHLIENALKYSDSPHPVVVRARDDDGELRFDVVDGGVGLVSSDIPHIFDRFKQVDNSSTRAHGGTGVGLYLCANLVRMHGGRICVDSAWGKGSTFSFTLPARSGSPDVTRITGRKLESTPYARGA